MADNRDAAKQVAHGERFHEAVLAKGTPFAAVFYLLLTGFLLGAVGSIVAAIMGGQALAALPGLLLGATLLYYAQKENLYDGVAILLLPYLVTGIILTYTTATMLSDIFGTLTSPTLTTAVFTAVPILLLGAVSAYLFNAVSTTRRELGGPALIGSTIIAGGAAVARLVQASIRQLIEHTSATGGSGGVAPSTFLNMNAAPNPDVLFITVLFAFNLPFLHYTRRRFALSRRDFAWYLLPISIYLTIGVVGGILLF